MPHDIARKIDPRLRRYAEHGGVPLEPHESPYIRRLGARAFGPTNPDDKPRDDDLFAPVFIEVANAATMKWVDDLPDVKQFVNIVAGYCTAMVSPDRLVTLAAHEGITEIEALRFAVPQLDHSVKSIHGWDGLPPTDPRRQTQGEGVVIGIVDYGLDFMLDDFKGVNGSTRIAYLWDQRLKVEGAEKSPKKYEYGVEYSAADIERALKADNPAAVVRHDPAEPSDVAGHGTHVAGIAAGNGSTFDADYAAGEYVGVAAGATIVFVHLEREEIRRHVESGLGTLANSINLIHAIAYCFEKADELGMPCVVNLSMGFNGGGHDGNMAVECIIEALLQKSGRAVVAAAGNEDEWGIYYGGNLKLGAHEKIAWALGNSLAYYDDLSTNEIEIWYSNNSKLHARLVAPDGEATPWIAPDVKTVPFDFKKGELAVITSDQRTVWNGAARIHILLSKGNRDAGIRFGSWAVELEAGYAAPEEANGVRFDAWIERTLPMDAPAYWHSRFQNYDARKAITLTTPATARNVIAVASYARSQSVVWVSDFSGRGPTRDGCKKPELAAPGERIYSSNAGAGRGRPARKSMGGTSMSAPHVTGVVARLLSRHGYLTAAEIRKLLVDSADDVSGGGAWHPKWGYGKVNAWRAVQLLDVYLA